MVETLDTFWESLDLSNGKSSGQNFMIRFARIISYI
jgi:hypothetical protein